MNERFWKGLGYWLVVAACLTVTRASTGRALPAARGGTPPHPSVAVPGESPSPEPSPSEVPPNPVPSPIPSVIPSPSPIPTPGFIIDHLGGDITTQSGGTASYQLQLTDRPTGNVVLNLTSSDPSNGTVSPAQILFTTATDPNPANPTVANAWNDAASFTVTGQNNGYALAAQQYQIVLSVDPTTADPGYRRLTPGVILGLTNTGTLRASFVVRPSNSSQLPIMTSGSAPFGTFAVNLGTKPSAITEIDLAMDSTAANSTTTVGQAFSLPPTTPGGAVNYAMSGFNPLTQTYQPLTGSSVIVRGAGYFIKPSVPVTLLTPQQDSTREPLSASNFAITLHMEASPPNMGFNLIGFPFDPANVTISNWANAVVEYQGARYPNIAAAAAAGIMSADLYEFNPSTDEYNVVVPSVLLPDNGYFVRTFKEGVVVILPAG